MNMGGTSFAAVTLMPIKKAKFKKGSAPGASVNVLEQRQEPAETHENGEQQAPLPELDNQPVSEPTNGAPPEEKPPETKPKVKFVASFNDGALLEIIGKTDEKYDVEFYDRTDKVVRYRTTMSGETWGAPNIRYFREWCITVRDSSDKVVFSHTYNARSRLVHIIVDSDLLGDNLAWMPYVEEFRKKWQCKLICSTHFKSLFKNAYPQIEFIDRHDPFPADSYARYTLGWFHNSHDTPQPRVRPLQASAADILGVPYREMRPRLDFTPGYRPIQARYVCIITHASMELKMWNRPGAWNELVEKLMAEGIRVVGISKEGCKVPGVIEVGSLPLETVMNWIHHSEFVIGTSSGLSWLAWALNKHVVMIANFTPEGHEFIENVTRITNTSVCHGCWTDLEIPWKSDFDWCPRLANTERKYECHSSITPDMVLERIRVFIERCRG
jgi:autotransporter strand-loop-strand O-heptosyltransferase